MTELRKHTICFWLFAVATLCFMVFIFCMSAQTIDESLETSGSLTMWLAEFFYGSDGAMTEELLEPVSVLVRKTAHMGEYAILFLLSYGTVHFYNETYGVRKQLLVKCNWLIAYGWTVFYAATDEFHQIFSGRGAMVVDVLIDAMGALIGTVLLFGLARSFRGESLRQKLDWFVYTVDSAVLIYLLAFVLFHREVFGIFL